MMDLFNLEFNSVRLIITGSSIGLKLLLYYDFGYSPWEEAYHAKCVTIFEAFVYIQST